MSLLLVALVAAVLVTLPVATRSASAGTDDYPHKTAADCARQFGTYSWCIDGNGDGVFQSSEQYSSRGYSYRNCTDFVAFRLSSRNGFSLPRAIGNANAWDDWARRSGYAVDGTPAVGSVAQTDAGTFGHVAWVSAVGSGTVTVEEYNRAGTGVWSERTVSTSTFVYLHLKDIAGPGVPAGPLSATAFGVTAPGGFFVKAPITETFTVTNTTTQSMTVPLLFLAVRDPWGSNYDQLCAQNVVLAPGASRTCKLTNSWGSVGTYRVWPAARMTDGSFLNIAPEKTFSLKAA